MFGKRYKAFAGNDTAIVVGQPLQLNGQGAELFEWNSTNRVIK